jgi:DNA-binding FadR family transcriptional regulator
MIEKIKKHSLSDEVYEILKTNILLEYKEGSLIPSENKLSKILNVSRVVVREALSKLREERIIVTYQGKGSFVANPQNFIDYNGKSTSLSYKFFKEIMEFRSLIECSAVLQAVNKATEEDFDFLRKTVNEMHLTCNDVNEFNQADYNFHLAVIKCSHNKTYLTAMESVKESVILCLDAMNKMNQARDWALDLHPKIAECIINRDGKGAVDLLKNSGEYNIARMKELFF